MRCATLVMLKLPCLWEKSQKRVFFDVSEAVVMAFCVAGVALRGIPTCFTTCQKVVFVWQAQYFCYIFKKIKKVCCIFRGTRSTLDPSDVIFRGTPRSALDVSRSVFSVNRIVSAARSGDKV